MNLTEARKAAPFAFVTENDNGYSRVRVPGHEGRVYEVHISRKGSLYSLKCLQDMGRLGVTACKAWDRGLICYHQLSAMMKVAEDQGYSVAWCRSKSDRDRLLNLGGKPIKVASSHSRNGNGVAWGVARGGKGNE
ncbi:MAG: hypothetical protein ACXABY_24710 [Candidatus Thorarchaeota archaeon]|jgi:hypothetical protein